MVVRPNFAFEGILNMFTWNGDFWIDFFSNIHLNNVIEVTSGILK